jgi:hypothetical protein
MGISGDLRSLAGRGLRTLSVKRVQAEGEEDCLVQMKAVIGEVSLEEALCGTSRFDADVGQLLSRIGEKVVEVPQAKLNQVPFVSDWEEERFGQILQAMVVLRLESFEIVFGCRVDVYVMFKDSHLRSSRDAPELPDAAVHMERALGEWRRLRRMKNA